MPRGTRMTLTCQDYGLIIVLTTNQLVSSSEQSQCEQQSFKALEYNIETMPIMTRDENGMQKPSMVRNMHNESCSQAALIFLFI